MKYFFWKISWIASLVLLVNEVFFLDGFDEVMVTAYIFLSTFTLYISYNYDQPNFLYRLDDYSSTLYRLTKIVGYLLISYVVLLIAYDYNLVF